MARMLLASMLLVTAVLAGSGGAAEGQQAPTQQGSQPQASVPDGQDGTFRTRTDLLTLDVSVLDGRGQPVQGLQPADFTITNQRPESPRRGCGARDGGLGTHGRPAGGPGRSVGDCQRRSRRRPSNPDCRRSALHPTGRNHAAPEIGGGVRRSTDVSGSGGVRSVPLAGTTCGLHERQGARASGDARACRPAADGQNQRVRHRTRRSAHHQRQGAPQVPNQVDATAPDPPVVEWILERSCPPPLAENILRCRRQIIAESTQIAQEARLDARISIRTLESNHQRARPARWHQVAHPDLGEPRDRRSQRARYLVPSRRGGAPVAQRDSGRCAT